MFPTKTNHAFDIKLAEQYGIDAALVLGRIAYFVEHHRANQTQFYDGHYWTYDTADALASHFTYWTKNKIQKLMVRLEDKGLIVSGDYSENRAVRPKYYRLGDMFHKKPDTDEPESQTAGSTESQMADSTESQTADSSLPIQSTKQSSNKKNINKKNPIPKKYQSLDFSSLGLSESELLEFIKLRELKKAPITDRVIRNIAKELDATRAKGYTNEQILNVWLERGWNSFKSEWFIKAMTGYGHQQQDTRNNFESNNKFEGINYINFDGKSEA